MPLLFPRNYTFIKSRPGLHADYSKIRARIFLHPDITALCPYQWHPSTPFRSFLRP